MFTLEQNIYFYRGNIMQENFVFDNWSDIIIKFSDFPKSNFYQLENFSSSDIERCVRSFWKRF